MEKWFFALKRNSLSALQKRKMAQIGVAAASTNVTLGLKLRQKESADVMFKIISHVYLLTSTYILT